MPDEQTFDRSPFDIDPEIEALIAELEPADLEPVTPPPDVWAGIERQLADEPAPVVDLARRRATTTRAPWLLGVAAALVLVVVGVAVVMNRSTDEAVLATAELAHDAEAFDPLGAGATATARLVERDGGFEIVLDDASFPTVDEDADLELWLIEADDTGAIVDVAPVSLVSGPGSYTVPATLDVSTHRIVDISIEPRDGDDAHSGRSILRGTLVEA
ncbi:MAG TPA: anti-sigma factor [Ilumatobacter sp.]|nr:anti-sigma factor [Ilumatobacter sp.]